MFIELTPEGHERKCLLNVEHIGHVWRDGTGSCVVIYAEEHYYEESYEQVKELIKNEVAAERGY